LPLYLGRVSRLRGVLAAYDHAAGLGVRAPQDRQGIDEYVDPFPALEPAHQSYEGAFRRKSKQTPHIYWRWQSIRIEAVKIRPRVHRA
jgi:hypothetical protein